MTNYLQSKTWKATDMAIVPITQGQEDEIIKNTDAQIGKAIQQMLDLGDFKAKQGETKMVFPSSGDIKRILLVGLGKGEETGVKSWKESISGAIKVAQSTKVDAVSVYIHPHFIDTYGAEAVAKQTTIATQIGMYGFDLYKDKEEKIHEIKEISFISPKSITDQFKKGVDHGQKIGESVNVTRQLGNVPPTEMTPDYLVEEAKKLDEAHKNLKTTILREDEMRDLGMGCLLGVARGSKLDPAFIVMDYNGAGDDEKPIVFVGKGITFDSGGLSLKPSNYMTDMKFDMLGAATVFGIINAVASLGLKKHVIGIVPTCENMPGGDAYRPDDILVAMNGKSVLINNTDAEGRLILADALCYVHDLKPKEVIDFATLTGACMVALGNERSGLFTPDDDIAENVMIAAKQTGEQFWRLPVGQEYSKAMKSEVADIKNTGNVGGRGYGGASTAAAFLQFFTKDYTQKEPKAYPWAHVDLSCSYYGEKGNSYMRGGANGFGVQTMVEYLVGGGNK